MADKVLTLAELGLLERGQFELMVNRAIRRLMADCRDRPFLDKPRSLLIQVDFVPASSETEGARGGLTVKVDGGVKEKIPPRLTNGEFLDVVDDVDANGEPVVNAVFAITPLFDRSN